MVKKNYDDMLSRLHPIPGRYRRTDGHNCYINIARQCAIKTRVVVPADDEKLESIFTRFDTIQTDRQTEEWT